MSGKSRSWQQTSSEMSRLGRRGWSSGGMRDPRLLGGPDPGWIDPRRLPPGESSSNTSIFGVSFSRSFLAKSLGASCFCKRKLRFKFNTRYQKQKQVSGNKILLAPMMGDASAVMDESFWHFSDFALPARHPTSQHDGRLFLSISFPVGRLLYGTWLCCCRD